jgi:predicted anti-sigma-YlaC factor YlaD
MTCERVLDLAVSFLDGTLGGETRAVVVHHLAWCNDCRNLIAALRDAPPEDPELTTSILQRTAGSVCDSVRERLCDFVDATLDPTEAGRVSGHLSRCPDCTALGRVLASAQSELPRLADVDPDPAFVALVLARTSGRPRRVPLAERWLAAVRQLLDRPRVALEGAFVAAAILVLPFGALRGHGSAKPAYTVVAIRHAAGTTSASLNMLAYDAWGTTRGILAEYAPRGTFSSAGAFSQPSDGTDELDRRPGTAQEKRR